MEKVTSFFVKPHRKSGLRKNSFIQMIDEVLHVLTLLGLNKHAKTLAVALPEQITANSSESRNSLSGTTNRTTPPKRPERGRLVTLGEIWQHSIRPRPRSEISLTPKKVKHLRTGITSPCVRVFRWTIQKSGRARYTIYTLFFFVWKD